MDNSLLVRRGKSMRSLQREVDGFALWQCHATHAFSKRLAF
jgi:hypothetical protein